MKKFVYTLVISIIVLNLYGCITPGVPGYISESVSNFDGSRQITIEPAWLYNSSIKLGLFKNSEMPDSTIVLIAVVKGAYSFSEGQSLHFKIDGKFESFSSIDNLTDMETSSGFYGSGIHIPASNWSSKRYLITKDFLNRLINADDVWVKIELRKEFVEGPFSSDFPTTARPAFKDFYDRIEKW
tara:strand:+ start:376 stop:927 length:552 start_codon:yes stop_codon:yes gene_type:complete